MDDESDKERQSDRFYNMEVECRERMDEDLCDLKTVPRKGTK